MSSTAGRLMTSSSFLACAAAGNTGSAPSCAARVGGAAVAPGPELALAEGAAGPVAGELADAAGPEAGGAGVTAGAPFASDGGGDCGSIRRGAYAEVSLPATLAAGAPASAACSVRTGNAASSTAPSTMASMLLRSIMVGTSPNPRD